MPKLTDTMHFMSNMTQREMVNSVVTGEVIFFYEFPQFSIIQLVLRKNEWQNAEGVIVVPFVTTQIWFTRLTRILVGDPFLLHSSNKALYFFIGEKSPHRF